LTKHAENIVHQFGFIYKINYYEALGSWVDINRKIPK